MLGYANLTLWASCEEFFQFDYSVSFARTSLDTGKDSLLINGREIPGKKGDVVSLAAGVLKLLQENNIESIIFNRGISLEEISVFLQLTSLGVEKLKAIGGLKETMTRNSIKNIKIDEGRYRKI